MLDRLAADSRFDLSYEELTAALSEGSANAGTASSQIDAFIAAAAAVVTEEERAYSPGSIL